MKMDDFTVVRIEDAIKESRDTTTFILPHKLNSKPGQFVMAWLPGAGERPFCISGEKEGSFMISVCGVGPVSKQMQKLKKGDRLGFRGPFGTHFTIPKNATSLAMVGGGYGSAPLAYLTDEAIAQGKKAYFIEGARNKERLVFLGRMRKAGAEVLVSTDDGSEGVKGYSTDLLKNILKMHKIDKVFTCGPEIMMKKVARVAQDAGIPSEVSIERYMKCGIGICGQCAIDEEGICLCKQGPVLSGKKALSLAEFGRYRRDSMGRKVEW